MPAVADVDTFDGRLLDALKQDVDVDSESIGHLVHRRESRVASGAFEQADLGAVESAEVAEGLLRQPLTLAFAAKSVLRNYLGGGDTRGWECGDALSPPSCQRLGPVSRFYFE